MARRFGSAMISNTDSILFVYPRRHIRVKAYISNESSLPGAQEEGFYVLIESKVSANLGELDAGPQYFAKQEKIGE